MKAKKTLHRIPASLVFLLIYFGANLSTYLLFGDPNHWSKFLYLATAPISFAENPFTNSLHSALCNGILGSLNFWVPLMLIAYADISEFKFPSDFSSLNILWLSFIASWLLSLSYFMAYGKPTKGSSIVGVCFLVFYWYLKPYWRWMTSTNSKKDSVTKRECAFFIVSVATIIFTFVIPKFPIFLGYFVNPGLATVSLHIQGFLVFLLLFVLSNREWVTKQGNVLFDIMHKK